MRKVSIHLGTEEVNSLQSILGKAFNDAVAYLVLWGMSYDDVEIYRDGKGYDLIAHYRHTEGHAEYTIGAIWRAGEAKYSFHS
ncbi:hypothetical protein SB861_37580 [Paraburkholderia sp. SIMBA_049]